MRVVRILGAVSVLALGLAACGGHPSAVAGKDTAGNAAASSGAAGSSSGSSAQRADAAPVRQVNGKPMWAANKRHSAEDNAQFQFGKNGADFAAASEDDYVTKAHAFIDNPPAGAETINRKNGDRLIYSAKANVFAVVTKEGAPRTMFKPRDGAAYWAQQKSREASAGRGGGDNSDG
jgi:pyocin large subunit-like protein